MTVRLYVPTDRKTWKRDGAGTPRRIPDLRVRCKKDHKVVFGTEEEAAHSAQRATFRGCPMKPYLGKCGHWHTARIKQ